MAPVTRYVFAEMLGISEHFPPNRGMATTSVRTGLAMTGNLETERQTPIFLFLPSTIGRLQNDAADGSVSRVVFRTLLNTT